MQITNKLMIIIFSLGLCFTQPYITAQEAPAAAPAARQECAICLVEKDIHDFFRLECGHEFCRACLHNTIVTAIDNRELVQLRCANCPHAFSDDEIREISGADRLNAIQDIRFQQALANMPGARQCPTPDCHHVFINEENRRVMYDCPACGNQYCANCLANHPGHVACAQNAHPNRDAWRNWPVADRKLRKPCPNCDAMIEKNGGCNHIDCANCHHEFCWLCFQPFWGEQHPEVHGGVFATEGDHLVASAGLGNLAIVQHFLENGTAVDTTEHYHDNTALIAAAAHGHAAVVDFLIAHGANVNHQNNAHQTAIMLAHDNGIRHALLAHGAVEYPAVAHNEHHIPGGVYHEPAAHPMPAAAAHAHELPDLGLELRIAILIDDLALVQLLLAQGAPINAHDHEGETPLIIAARINRMGIVRALVEHGAHVNDRDNDANDARTPLMYAAFHDNIAIVQLLIQHGAHVNDRDINGRTALLIAAAHGCSAIATALLDNGADINIPNNQGYTPLSLSIQNHHFDTAHLLIQRGAQCTRATKAYVWAKCHEKSLNIITGIIGTPLAVYCAYKTNKYLTRNPIYPELIKSMPTYPKLAAFIAGSVTLVNLIDSFIAFATTLGVTFGLKKLGMEGLRRAAN